MARHMDLRYHSVRNLVERNVAQLQHVRGTNNPADLLTKALGPKILFKQIELIGLSESVSIGLPGRVNI